MAADGLDLGLWLDIGSIHTEVSLLCLGVYGFRDKTRPNQLFAFALIGLRYYSNFQKNSFGI